ncbi:flavin-dependent oxidoreductase [Agromyces kandeliae]|uniref:Flavin-dependent oxidoreductase n=1 Tax=Agromyces kandeliae TaxID=2666141 RepID=A0A6L5R5J9_9MICO|nr:flavin-dependent oxidoreductase [Agromyces kandeliae]MRX45249.1 flavin-dependent oxidoreductase [Agromyces kandeliae]
MKILIVGAGIGGLATALSLHDAGIRDITIIEQVHELRPLGVGINLLPHAVRELTELGLGDEVARIGMPTSRLTYTNRFGQEIWSEPRGLDAGYRWPQYSVHRGELQMLLLAAVRSRLGAERVRLGLAAVSSDPRTDATSVTFREASGEERTLTADVVIAADGIHSALRKQRYPDEGDPVWNRLILWRGTAIAPAYLDGRTMIMAGDGLQKFVAYPLETPRPDGLARINFIAEYRASAGDTGISDWNRAVDPSRVIDMFADWRFDWLDVPGLIAASDQVLEYPMVDRDPVDRWTWGTQTLLGDAAHAMYPIGSNGASQAILDARTVARELATTADASAALAAYEHARRPVTAALTLSNRSLGPERVMQLAYERAPQGFDDIEQVVPLAERQRIAAEYKQAAGFDPSLLNDRPSLSVRPMAEGAGR